MCPEAVCLLAFSSSRRAGKDWRAMGLDSAPADAVHNAVSAICRAPPCCHLKSRLPSYTMITAQWKQSWCPTTRNLSQIIQGGAVLGSQNKKKNKNQQCNDSPALSHVVLVESLADRTLKETLSAAARGAHCCYGSGDTAHEMSLGGHSLKSDRPRKELI